MVRITGGRLKGRNINSSDTVELRPTTSFFREWIFNVLNNIAFIETVNLLDLYSGTGIISFEFISRGAISSLAVEKNSSLAASIRTGSVKLKLDNLDVINSDCKLFIKREAESNGLKKYNVIFMDPPYSKDFADDILELLFSYKNGLSEDIILIIETEKDKVLKTDSDFVILKEKSSGTTKITVIGRKE